MSNCNSLTCGQLGSWVSCGHQSYCKPCNGTADTTPACNPFATWGTATDSTSCQCNRCQNWGHCGHCGYWGHCNNWGSCNGCSWGCAGDSSCDTCTTCDQWNCAGSTGSVLTPRYVSIGRTFQRRITQTLCIDDLPDCAESPLTLVGVTVCGPASWEQISECRQQLLRVTVPVAVQIRDCAGRCRTGHSTVMLTIPLCMPCPAQDFWRSQLYVAPCIRLAAPVTENEDGCFDATLEVQAEVYRFQMHGNNC